MENIRNLCDVDFDLTKGADAVVVDEEGNCIELLRNSLEDETTLVETITWKKSWIDVRCEPIIDILNAKVIIDSDTSLDVYGDIKVCNVRGFGGFTVYQRDQFDSPQRIYSMHNFLQLTGPEEVPSLLQVETLLSVDISNSDTGDTIAFGEKRLKTITPPFYSNKFEKLENLEFHGLQFRGDARDGDLVDTGAHVELQYVAFAFGVYARVQMFLYKVDDAFDTQKINKDEDDDDDEQGVEIFGMVSARCNPLVLPKECYENHMFNVIKEEREWVGLGTEIDLSRNLVAVPAYSELEISVNLRRYEDDECIVQGSACFEPTNYTGGRKNIGGVNGFYVRVHVTWCEPSLLNNHWCDEDRIDGFCDVPHCPQLCASQLIEVFSLFIARPNGEEVNLYGSVKIYDSRGCCNIFSCSKNEAYFLSRGCNLLPMQGPKRAVTPGRVFSIEIDLSDIDGHVKIKGFAQSTVEIEERQRPWFNRRLCSVVGRANEKSFAAINYTYFSFAVQATVTVRLVYKCRSAHVKIHGDITALYDIHSPPSMAYDRDFSERVLFTRKEANPLEVGENLELSRNLIAVPMEIPLFVIVKLSFQTSEGTRHHGHVTKELRIGEPYIAIENNYFDICIDFQWKGLPFNMCLT